MIRTVLVGATRTIPANMQETGAIASARISPAYASGTTDYDDITNKPTINGIPLEGDMSLEDIGVVEADGSDIDAMFEK